MRGMTRLVGTGVVVAALLVAAVVAASGTAAPTATTGAPVTTVGVRSMWSDVAVGPVIGSRALLASAPAAPTDLGPADAAAVRARRLTGQSDATVRVVAEARPGTADAVADRAVALGGRIELRVGTLVQATVPASAVEPLASTGAVRRVRPPAVFVPSGTPGEGVAATNGPVWQAHGLTGKGVKVAVFDFGFAGLAERQAAGEIPASAVVVDLCAGNAAGPENHGTAVAEIVADLVPDAQLYLICIDTDVSLAAAEAYAKANGVRVVNLSGGFYNTWRGDGLGPAGTPDAIAADARANGILWINAAGNDARSHWSGVFTSADRDPFNDFAPGDELNAVVVPNGNVVCGFLRWDGWPVPTDDFDLGFYDVAAGAFVAVSDDDQLEEDLPPTEAFCIQNVSGAARLAGFVIVRYAGSGTPSFDLFVEGEPYGLALRYAVAGRSVADPAASPNVVTAGAACWRTGAIEPYSSQGPTIDGRVKPDLAAPDSVSTATYGPFTACGESGFSGTSAAAPHATGIAALVRQRFPKLPVDGVRALLLQEVADAGTPGVDPVYGAGNLRLRELPQAVLKALPARARAGTQTLLRFRVQEAQWDVRDHVHVYRGAKLLRSFELPFASGSTATARSVVWRSPARAPGRYRFCAEGWDRAGHASSTSCAVITVVR